MQELGLLALAVEIKPPSQPLQNITVKAPSPQPFQKRSNPTQPLHSMVKPAQAHSKPTRKLRAIPPSKHGQTHPKPTPNPPQTHPLLRSNPLQTHAHNPIADVALPQHLNSKSGPAIRLNIFAVQSPSLPKKLSFCNVWQATLHTLRPRWSTSQSLKRDFYPQKTAALPGRSPSYGEVGRPRF